MRTERGDGDLWAITSYFNPMRYRRRRFNHRLFRRNLVLPLVTVELAYHEGFELEDGDADVLVPLRARDVMWQKERLLNVALSVLPEHVTKVAWLDCDLVYEEAGWAEAASAALDRYPLIQLFREARYLGPEWVPGHPVERATQRLRPSHASGVSSGLSPVAALAERPPGARLGTYANGLAWAARRELLTRHGLYDARILGGGDRAILCAAYGCTDAMIDWHGLTAAEAEHYLAWARPFHASVRGEVGFLDATVLHLWHGDVSNRGLGSRQRVLSEFDYDPQRDIALDRGGCWRWSSHKPELHERVRDYFAARREDG